MVQQKIVPPFIDPVTGRRKNRIDMDVPMHDKPAYAMVPDELARALRFCYHGHRAEIYFNEIGWPEGLQYCKSSEYVLKTGHQCFVRTALEAGMVVPRPVLMLYPDYVQRFKIDLKTVPASWGGCCRRHRDQQIALLLPEIAALAKAIWNEARPELKLAYPNVNEGQWFVKQCLHAATRAFLFHISHREHIQQILEQLLSKKLAQALRREDQSAIEYWTLLNYGYQPEGVAHGDRVRRPTRTTHRRTKATRPVRPA